MTKTKLPVRYGKNWAAIAQIRDQSVRMAFSGLYIDSEVAQLLGSRLPEFFVDGDSTAPVAIPLSLLRREAAIDALESEGVAAESGMSRLASFGALTQLGIPLQAFGDRKGLNLMQKLPPGLKDLFRMARVGMMFFWEERSWVIVEVSERDGGELWFAPLECIDVNA